MLRRAGYELKYYIFNISVTRLTLLSWDRHYEYESQLFVTAMIRVTVSCEGNFLPTIIINSKVSLFVMLSHHNYSTDRHEILHTRY